MSGHACLRRRRRAEAPLEPGGDERMKRPSLRGRRRRQNFRGPAGADAQD